MLTDNNTVTITLANGTFKNPITASDFVFTGNDSVALAAGTFARVNDTTVKISNLNGLVGTNNKVSVKAETFATQKPSATVTALATTE